MRIAQNKLQKIKAAVHCAQVLFIFVAGCLTLAVMTKDGGFGGQTGFYFALCFLTLPAILYQVLVPLWSRAWRLNNVYAFVTVDILFAILWFAASIAVAVWNANGIAKGKPVTKDDADNTNKNARRADVMKDGTCASFGFGSEVKCKVSKATVGFGIIIFLMFAATTYLAVRNMIEFRRTGTLPNSNPKVHGKAEALAGEDRGKDQDPWSTNTDDLNSTDGLPYTYNNEGDREGLLNRNSDVEATQPADGFAHPGRKLSYQDSTHATVPPPYGETYAPSALSPTGLPTSPNGTLQFPEANYNALR